ncbi:hypothetical protein ACJQWK_08873 [Exserohilum turcicum]|uniref:Uncharacterized protein n=1 Tax=Exserohilum turcicum (strain 28A) TaxID=671987 RepID=R0KHK2_EXST2|nr:uncharacterized protein SETTUDRAFT_150511 [Exserohilum turcica Et28A]EOA87527.1 hypothetical protein SETTUDRAFT_150511 [Exserohilum turcica Et28A]
MKTTMIISAAALLFSGAFAAPAVARSDPVYFTVQLANDQTGKNANADVAVNTGPVTFGRLFGAAFGTPVKATSLQAVTPGAGGNNVRCVVYSPANTLYGRPLNAWNTFIDLDGDFTKSTPIDVTDFTISCEL